MLDKKECSTILLKRSTISRIKQLASKNQIYDDFINLLMDKYEEK